MAMSAMKFPRIACAPLRLAGVVLPAFMLTVALSIKAQAQEGIPLPGNSYESTAPIPGAEAMPSAAAPVVGAPPAAAPAGKGRAVSQYRQLPLNPGQAKAKIVELTNLVAVSRPQDVQERVYQLCEWLADMADAHNRMAVAFSKHDTTKAQSNAERQLQQKFSQLKNEAQLLKADLLINQKRFPEAIGPLVDIVLAEPTSPTGEEAYRRLQDMGFSHAVTPAATPAEPAPPVAPPPAAKKPPKIISRG